MPRLIHLNGPTGVGKSTIAALYAHRHPGVLNLDTDRIVCLIGGWQDDFWNALHPARRLAIGMVETHLRGGFDVVMPQLVAKLSEIERFEEVVRAVGGEYREIVLMAEKDSVQRRFTRRAASGDPAPHRRIDEIVQRAGGVALVARIHDHVNGFLAGRPDARVVHADTDDPERTYADVLVALGE